jgi:hypothetical protein
VVKSLPVGITVPYGLTNSIWSKTHFHNHSKKLLLLRLYSGLGFNDIKLASLQAVRTARIYRNGEVGVF